MDFASSDLLREDSASQPMDAVLRENLPEEHVVPDRPMPRGPQTDPCELIREPIPQRPEGASAPYAPANVPQETPMTCSPRNEAPCENAPIKDSAPGHVYGQPMNMGQGSPRNAGFESAYGRTLSRNPANPYSPDYYSAGGYRAPYVPYSPVRVPVQKNNKPITALVLGSLAMVFLNYFPFVAMVLGIVAICIGFSGLKQGELTKGKRVCGLIGLSLGIVSLILSVTMLIMLVVLYLRAFSTLGVFGDSILS